MMQSRVLRPTMSARRAVLWHPSNIPVLAAAALCAVIAAGVALLLIPTMPRPLAPLLVDFYAVEHNAALDYNFSEPQGYLLLPPPAARAVLTLRLFRPSPLPPQQVDVDLDARALFTHPVDATPRVWHLLLPTAAPPRSELLLGLRTLGAQVPQDSRALGVLLDDVVVTPLAVPQRNGVLYAASVLLGVFALGFVAARWRWAWRAISWHAVVACALLAAFVVVMGRYSIVRHARFGSNGYDLGQYDQVLWLLSRGFEPYSTTMGLHILGNHAAVVLYLLAPLYWWPDVRVLLVFQSLVVACGALPLYLLGHARGSAVAGLIAMGALLAHPSTQNMLLFDFHPDAIGGAALAWAIYCVERRRWLAVLGCVGLLLACKENFALTGGVLGLWLLGRRHWRVGLLTLACSAVWLVATTQLLQPYFNGQSQAIHLSRLGHYGTTPGEILATVAQRPWLVLGDLLRPASAAYLLLLLLPFGLLPLLRPGYLVLALPALTLNLLSNFPPQRTLAFHYDALIVPVMAFALCQVLVATTQLRARQGLLLALASLAIMGGAGVAQATTRSRVAELHAELNSARQRHRIWRYVVERIPPEVGVSAQSRFQPHLTHRRQAYLFPNPFVEALFYNRQAMPFVPDVGYVLFDTKLAADFERSAAEQLALIDQLQRNGSFHQIVDLDGVVLLKQNAPAPTK